MRSIETKEDTFGVELAKEVIQQIVKYSKIEIHKKFSEQQE